MEVTFYAHPRSPPKWQWLPQRLDAAPDSPERLVPGDISRHQFCDFPPIQGDHRFLPSVVDLNRRDPSGNSRRHSGPVRKPEGLQECSPGMSEARAIPWVSWPAARGSKASVSSEPHSRQQRLGAVLLAGRGCQRRRGLARRCCAPGTQGIARQASLIPGLDSGSLSGYKRLNSYASRHHLL